MKMYIMRCTSGFRPSCSCRVGMKNAAMKQNGG